MALLVFVEVITTKEFDRWYFRISHKERMQVDARIAKIEQFEHFGDWKYLNDGIAELRWKSGRRVYFARVGHKIILLLNGGLKHGQKKDIKRAKSIFRRYADS